MTDWFIIHLDPNEDLGSVYEKISKSGSTQLLLVLPRQKGIIGQRLNLALLNRHALHSGYQVAILTREPEIINYANVSGIPVFPTAEKARKSRVKNSPKKFIYPPRNRPNREQLVRYFSGNRLSTPNHYEIWRIPVFLAGLISVFSLFLLYFPHAEIIFSPPVRKHEVQIPIHAAPDISSSSIFGEVPLKTETIVLRGEGQARASGEIIIPLKKAGGTIEIRNLSDRMFLLPAGTIVRTLGDSPVRFKTLHPSQIQNNLIDPEIVRIEALEPGSSGNVESNSIQMIEGENGLYLSITNPSPTMGGEDINEAAPSIEDINKLQEDISGKLIKKALENLLSQQNDRVFLEDSIKIKEVSDIAINPEEGFPSDKVEIELTAVIEILYYQQEDVERIAQTALQMSLPEGLLPMEGTLSVVNVGDKETLYNGFQWQVNAGILTFPGWKTEKILPLILGKKISQAEQILMDQLNLKLAPSISVWPKFWDRIPLIPFRIKINYDQNISS